ncbi:BTAD domain-containing putative transcriptional regulator [Nonomuraea sp. NPDC050790]|uniref:AfsR/SARP family transcriptional regulator n=1 Tax=Nonomuraea sp. NPDC050790 TaxID=3364371 RepID=UPI0037A1AB62
MTSDVRIRLLGVVGGSTTRGAIDLGPPRQQAVLAMLACHAPQPVGISDLVDGLWSGDPPRTAQQSIYTYIAGLRRVLDDSRAPRAQGSVILAAGRGYQLLLDPRQIDARLFALHLEEARLLQGGDRHSEALPLLERALGLAQGPPLSGVPGPFADAERARLRELHLSAVERRAESLLRLGRAGDALPALQESVARHPSHERLRELLMLALFQDGRQAEALAVFAEGRRVLAEELGVDPGEGLRAAHELVLRGVAAPRPGVPRELPRPLSGFVGRDAEIVRLRSLLDPEGGGTPHPFVAICGPPGVGKSALAVLLADAVKDRFPDGQLFVNLRGATPELAPLSPVDVFGRFLRALGVAGQVVPADADEAAALWRTHIDGRRLLIVLDDAAGLRQILPLLGVPLGTSVLVTGRETLSGGDDCEQLVLSGLSSAESAEMLAKLAGSERVAAQPADAARVAHMCGGLPLALRIAGARLAERPEWSLSALAARLSDERTRLDELQIGTLAVQPSMASSWTALRDAGRARDSAAARLLALLGVLHLPDVTAEIAGALLGGPAAAARGALDRLVEVHLLEPVQDDRFQMHDLVRLFATTLRPEGARETVVRVLTCLIATTRRAVNLTDPQRVLAPLPELDAPPAPLRDAGQARRWLLDEEANLLAATKQAMSDDDEEIARLGVALTFALMWFQHGTYRLTEMSACNEQALEVAARLDDGSLACHAHNHLAFVALHRGQLAEALRHRELELDLARRSGDTFSEQRSLGNLANIHVKRGDCELALEYAARQYEIARELGSRLGMRYAQMMRGDALRYLGRREEAVSALDEAMASAVADDDAHHEAALHMILGEICLEERRPADALGSLHRSLELNRKVIYRVAEVRVLVRISQAHRQLGQPALALEHVEQALLLSRTLDRSEWQGQARQEHAAVYRELGVPPVDPA